MPRKSISSVPSKPKKGSRTGGTGVIYGRYSSHNQKDISIEQQVSLCRELADSFGIEVIDVYADRAVSGKTDKRPEFQRMMKDSTKKKFQYVLSWKSSRIGRNMLEAMMNECRLADNGVRIVYAEEDFDDTAAGRFAARSMMNVNQFYIENMAEDVKRGMNSNAENCLANGPAPFGYKVDDKLHYVIDPPKDEIVREIFQRVARGDKFVDICDDLNNRGIKTAKGNKWGRSSFQTLLKNERYRGIYIFDEIRIEGGMPRIVSDELFFKVQNVLRTKKNAQGRHRVNGDYLLTGKLFCGHCKKPMVGISGTANNGALYYYYTCKGRREKSCKKKNVSRDFIEKEVARCVREFILQDDVFEWIANIIEKYQSEINNKPELDMLRDRLADITRSIKNIVTAIENGVFTSSTKDRLNELEAEKREVTTSISQLEKECPIVTREQVMDWLESFRNGSIDDKQYQFLLFNSFLNAVYLYDDKRIKIVFSMSDDISEIETLIDNDESGEMNECSYNLCNGSPQQSQTNYAIITMVNSVFVLTCKYD